MYNPTAKGYFSGCGGMELGLIQAGINVIQSLDLDSEATNCMKQNILEPHSGCTAALSQFPTLTAAFPN